ncbi:hypothetical protein OG775_34805 [Streptomyces platensis]|uniref:type ISP restriction/modification enzyme n=1 Tax=Streptomyces platensis TaxID=58346 RepID=UPI0022589ADF|nr:type ISP restriction/modification enzyme [Streptomyces platensis]MCX4640219.1 hypothetical protein [Streptomyces platensis]
MADDGATFFPGDGPSSRISVTLAAGTLQAIRERVGKRGTSAWLEEATQRQIKRHNLDELTADLDQINGPTGSLAAEKETVPVIVPYGPMTFDRQMHLRGPESDRPGRGQPCGSRTTTSVRATCPNSTQNQAVRAGGELHRPSARRSSLQRHRRRPRRPLYRHPHQAEPNVTPGLLQLLTKMRGVTVTAEDLFAYIAGTASHNGYTRRFSANLGERGAVSP